MTNATDIVAYTYQAEILCPQCVVAAISEDHGVEPPMSHVSAEAYLDHLSQEVFQIDRRDESSFDSDEFPKVVFADSIESYVTGRDPATGREMWSGEHCGNCGEELI